MMLNVPTYEVETRFWFESHDELYQWLSFLKPCLDREEVWVTIFYGLDVFKLGKLLRIAEVFRDREKRYFLGWKGTDIGGFANIREELQEEITNGIDQSIILPLIGGSSTYSSFNSIVSGIERLGHHQFMSFTGRNIVGSYEPLDLQLKVMSCSVLKYPLLVEIEKTAQTYNEAVEAENVLREFVSTYSLQQRIVRQEPPSLLYEAAFKAT